MSEFYCTICGNKGIKIPRPGRQREPGHLKKLYCLHCNCETNHAEIKEWTHYSLEDFKFEFENGNFTSTGERKKSYGAFRAEMSKKGILLP